MIKQLELNEDLLKESGIPKPFWTLGRDTYWGVPSGIQRVESYVRKAEEALNTGMGLYLYGPKGSLKTFLLTYALRLLMVDRYDTRYVCFDRLVELYWNSRIFLELVTDSEFLAIDGVDIPEKGGAKMILDQLFHLRIDEGKPILLASNLNLEQLSSHYRESAINAIRQNCIEIELKVDLVRRDNHYRKLKQKFVSS